MILLLRVLFDTLVNVCVGIVEQSLQKYELSHKKNRTSNSMCKAIRNIEHRGDLK
jgi:hypothetical protein